MIRTTIGVDIGGTNIRAARVGADGKILARARAASSTDPTVVIERVEVLVAGIDDETVQGIGIGVPGQVHFASGRVLSGGYVDLSAVPVRERLEARFGRNVVIDNDGNMALVAEAQCGAAVGRSDAAMLTIGTGIGGAILVDGRIFRGAGAAGQLGHIVVDPQGLPCKCGRNGCVETMSSGTALGRHIAEAGLPAATTAASLLERRASGDALADKVLRSWAQPLRAAIDSLAATLHPQTIVLGGGLGSEAVAALSPYPDKSSWFSYELVAASLGDDAGVIGAALAALPSRRAGKRLVMVNGVPASGKSSVAAGLAKATGWPVLSLDTIKNPFLEEIETVDRPFNRKLGRASLKAMFAVLGEAPDGATFIMDAWFGFQPREFVQDLIDAAGIDTIAEIWCSAPPEIIGDRYSTRTASRLPGHPGPEYVPELVALASRAEPSRFGPVHEVDTTTALDTITIRKFLEQVFDGPRACGLD
ncbi:ROK family protein [Mesorhizobium sp. BE184]|uniref:ROK family protein n=1 Tax=Mesorhizobium sp. BE184 TaxID=2817714 RepID=UPI0028614166|nr:ROK family protein [Mesorhizobium sp. BE184]MDR7034934.1 glucokinase [Mesorhizobium sp. BE184]